MPQRCPVHPSSLKASGPFSSSLEFESRSHSTSKLLDRNPFRSHGNRLTCMSTKKSRTCLEQWIYVWMYICMHDNACLSMRVCVRLCMCMFVRLYVCLYVCMYVPHVRYECMYVWMNDEWVKDCMVTYGCKKISVTWYGALVVYCSPVQCGVVCVCMYACMYVCVNVWTYHCLNACMYARITYLAS